MNLYLSAIGFSDMDSMKESRFIKAAVRQCIDEGYILKNESLKRGVAVVRVSVRHRTGRTARHFDRRMAGIGDRNDRNRVVVVVVDRSVCHLHQPQHHLDDQPRRQRDRRQRA